jgi:hypothetical protein
MWEGWLMKKGYFAAFLVVCMFLAFWSGVQGGDKKEVTLKGTVQCAKCSLAIEKKCATVITVKEGDKDVNYFFDTDSNKKFHKDICQEAKKGSVTGVVSEKDNKKFIAATKVEYSN